MKSPRLRRRGGVDKDERLLKHRRSRLRRMVAMKSPRLRRRGAVDKGEHAVVEERSML
jgi:hypothetical protein